MNNSHTTWHIGLTGGIGSGKSTVAHMLAQHGATVIDADALSRAATANGGAAIDAIAAAFGTSFIDADGALNRAAMRELVFNQPSARQRLESIIHPIVLQQIRHTAQQACAQGARAVVYDIPLLAESSHWRQRLQHVIVVDCDNATQIARVQQRNQLEPAAIQGIIQAQASRSQRLAIADSVLQNGKNCTLSQLKQQVDALALHFRIIIP